MLSLIHLLYITTGTVIMHDVTTFKMTYVAAGSAVVPPPHQSIERLFTLHTHRHFVVPDPARGALPQLRVLHQSKNILSRTVQRVDSLTGCATLDVTLTDTSSTSFNAFLNDSFFCWKISMVSWKAWRKKKSFHITYKHIRSNEKNSDENYCGCTICTLIQPALSCSELRRKCKARISIKALKM